jgi:hypothetical protein
LSPTGSGATAWLSADGDLLLRDRSRPLIGRAHPGAVLAHVVGDGACRGQHSDEAEDAARTRPFDEFVADRPDEPSQLPQPLADALRSPPVYGKDFDADNTRKALAEATRKRTSEWTARTS